MVSQRLLSSKVVSQGLLSLKLMVAAGFIIFCKMPAALFTPFLYDNNIIFCRVKNFAPLLFLPSLGMNDTDVMACSWLHWIRHEGKGKEVRKVKRERWQHCHLQAQKHCPVVSTWEDLATQEEILGGRTGMGWCIDGNRCWACTHRMKEAAHDFNFLRPYSILIPVVSQVSRWHRNHGGRGGICLQTPQT